MKKPKLMLKVDPQPIKIYPFLKTRKGVWEGDKLERLHHNYAVTQKEGANKKNSKTIRNL